MTLFETITLIILCIMVILCFAQIAEMIAWHKNIKKYDNKIRIRHSKFGSYIWILVALVNIVAESIVFVNSVPTYNYNTRTTGYIYIIFMWTAFLIYTFIPVLFARSHYVTPDGLLVQGAKGDFYSKDDVKYKINGDTLELYYKKLSGAVEYKIVENKDELTEMLSTNYKLYEKSNKKEKKS